MLVAREKMVDQRSAANAVLSEAADPVSAKALSAMIAGRDRVIEIYDRGIGELIAGDADHAESREFSNRSPASAPWRQLR